ncbi:TPA: hypothetical protein ACNUUK_004230 [Aeromonas salmonicida subsp. smithia]
MNNLKKALVVLLTFFYFFRPQLFHPMLSTALIPAAIGWFQFMFNKNIRMLTWQRTGVLFWFSFSFIFLWALFIDLGTGGILSAGPRSFTASNIRFLFVTVGGGICIALVFARGDKKELMSLMVKAVVTQIAIGIVMLFFPELKRFIYIYISGYSGSEKIFYDWFFYTRIFGWSEELFYLAPVLMTFILSLFFYKPQRIFSNLFFIVSIAISLMNARLAILGVIWGLMIRTGFIKTTLFFLLLVPLVLGVMTLYFQDNPIYNLIFSEFEGGRSRTFDILIEHHLIWLGKDSFDFILGPMAYVHAGERKVTVDIGWLIIGNFGGVLFILAWVALLISLCDKAFVTMQLKLLAFIMLALFGFKGLLFSSNAIINMMVVFSLIGGVSAEFIRKDYR